MMRDFFNILIVLGAIQGIISSVLLFSYKSKKQANTLLAWLILIISLACLNLYFLETVQSTSRIWKVIAEVTPLIVLMPLGPLVYFYVKAMLFPEFRMDKKSRPHFYSIVIDLTPYLAASTLLLGSFWGYIKADRVQNWQQFIDMYFVYSDIPRWVSLTIYLWFTQKLISQYSTNSSQNPTLKWTRHFTRGFTIFAIIWLLHLVPYLIPSLSDQLLAAVGWYPIYMPMIVLIYWLGISGFLVSIKTHRIASKSPVLPQETIGLTSAALTRAMEEAQLYLNPTLKLDDVVKYLGIPQKLISAVLNQHLNKSFNEFVNGYRIEACKVRLRSDSSNLTITGIAYECGFNSQATFQRAFKTATGLTPKEYKQKQSKNSTQF